MSEEPLTFNLLFSIPQIDSAFMRNPARGGRIKLDLETACIPDVNAMIDLAVARAGTTFAAVVVVVEQPGDLLNKDNKNGTSKRKNKQSEWQTAEKSHTDNGA